VDKLLEAYIGRCFFPV